ncbi:MAG: hypothetical protein J5379_08335 [Clostridiales bacterium]|nr:hypothetical protein [Clostridiales bacterium]
MKLLPALPKEWKKYGKVEGLRLRGGRILRCLEWKDGEILRAEIEDE